MSRINYQRQLEEQLARIEENGARPRLLLHSCCAPCSSYVLEYLDRWFDITAYYYNPNIAPREEFDRRSAELVRLVQAMPHQGDMQVIVGDYVPELFYSACRGHEGPFKARTTEHSSCRQEKPTAGHSMPCHACSPDRKRACSLGQPLHMQAFPVQSLVPEHQLLQWAQPRGHTGKRAAPIPGPW